MDRCWCYSRCLSLDWSWGLLCLGWGGHLLCLGWGWRWGWGGCLNRTCALSLSRDVGRGLQPLLVLGLVVGLV